MNRPILVTYEIGCLEPEGVNMLGTGFLINGNGFIATTYHVVSSFPRNLVTVLPNAPINGYQNLSNKECTYFPCEIKEIDPFRDIAILKADINFTDNLFPLSGLNQVNVGDEIVIYGFPHCVEGRHALTYQKTEIGAKITVDIDGVKLKQAVINMQSRPGQSGSPIVSISKKAIVGLLVGAWTPGQSGISLGGIDPRELHQTTHCISAEYIGEMIL